MNQTGKTMRVYVKALLAKKLSGPLGAEISEGRGSRVRIGLQEMRAVFYRPHPERVTDKGTVKSVGRFLLEAGVKQ